MQLRFRQLQAFHAVIETGTVTGAAEKLGISQPGISNLLAQLERQTRAPLFERVRGRLVPTPEASLIYREVDTVVRGLDHVAQAMTDLDNKRAGQLQVVAAPALSFRFLPAEIARFAAGWPDLSVSLQAQYSAKVQEWVVAGLYEIGVTEEPLRHRALDGRFLRFTTMCTLPEGHPLARHDVLTPELLEDVPFVVLGNEHMVHSRLREAFQARGIRWNTVISTHLFENALSFVKNGMGVSLIDPFTLAFDDQGGFVTRPFLPEITLDLAVVTLSGRPLSAVGRAFLDQLVTSMQAHATHSETGAAAS